LDLVKVRFQADTSAKLPTIASKTRSIVVEEGWRALFNGLTPALLASALSWGGFFFFYERAKARWTRLVDNALGAAWRDSCASIEAGCIMVLVTNPVWLVKTRLQLQRGDGLDPTKTGRRPYTGMFDAFYRIVTEEGVRALYRGVLPAILLTSHGAIQLVVYEQLKRLKAPDSWGAPLALAYGSIAKLAASISTYPYQLVKTRLQQRYPNTGTKYATNLVGGECVPSRCSRDESRVVFGWSPGSCAPGSASRTRGTHTDVARSSVLLRAHSRRRLEGPRAFFKGVWPNSLRVVPNAAITFWVYELIVRSTPA